MPAFSLLAPSSNHQITANHGRKSPKLLDSPDSCGTYSSSLLLNRTAGSRTPEFNKIYIYTSEKQRHQKGQTQCWFELLR